MKIGFIGQGFIGKNYADDFVNRGFDVVRYSQEAPYIENKEKIKECDIVFIAVPTPSLPSGFDYSIVRSVLSLIGTGKTAVIKSTILPGVTEILQNEFPHISVMHSPEFLREATAAYDAAHPDRNIIGIPNQSDEMKAKATQVLGVLPKAEFELICPSIDAEVVKYAGNCFLFTKVVFMNILYDTVAKIGGSWDTVKNAVGHDPRIGTSHMSPVDQNGRGAGGHCFIKDFKAFSDFYKQTVGEPLSTEVLDALENKNTNLLVTSKKDLDLLEGVYGKEIIS
jgi:nucleotide sugar dehydrogenase